MDKQKKIDANYPSSAKARAKKLGEKSFGDQWVASAVNALSTRLEDPSISTESTNLARTAPSAKNASSTFNSSGDQEITSGTNANDNFELTATQSPNISDVEEVTSIVVSADKKQKCQIRSDANHLQIHGDIQKLIVLRLQESAMTIRDLCASLMHISREQIQVIELLDIDQKLKSMVLGWEVIFPSPYMHGGKARELQTCISTFVRTLCCQDKWSDESFDSFPVGSGEREAVKAAKKLRTARGNSEIPEKSKVECREFTSPIQFGSKFGPAPEEKPGEEVIESFGAFRGFYRDERKAFFAVDGMVQGKAKTLKFTDDQFEKIRRLCTNEVTLCKVKINQHLMGDSVDHLELMKIMSVTGDMFQ